MVDREAPVALATKQEPGKVSYHARWRWNAADPWRLCWLTVAQITHYEGRGAQVQLAAWLDPDAAGELAPGAFLPPAEPAPAETMN